MSVMGLAYGIAHVVFTRKSRYTSTFVKGCSSTTSVFHARQLAAILVSHIPILGVALKLAFDELTE